MKKIVATFSIVIMIILFGMVGKVQADYNATIELQFKTINNEKNDKFDLYILLPESYITYTIQKDQLDFSYEGAETLKKNTIPSIFIKKDKVKDDTYTEKDIEYVQIALEPNEKGIYTFDILADYGELDMKYRIKNTEKDYIMHIDNFRVVKNECEIEYDYHKNTVKQPDKKVISFGTIALIVILIIVIILGFISYTKQRSR